MLISTEAREQWKERSFPVPFSCFYMVKSCSVYARALVFERSGDAILQESFSEQESAGPSRAPLTLPRVPNPTLLRSYNRTKQGKRTVGLHACRTQGPVQKGLYRRGTDLTA